jgi:hypothetical protein
MGPGQQAFSLGLRYGTLNSSFVTYTILMGECSVLNTPTGQASAFGLACGGRPEAWWGTPS